MTLIDDATGRTTAADRPRPSGFAAHCRRRIVRAVAWLLGTAGVVLRVRLRAQHLHLRGSGRVCVHLDRPRAPRRLSPSTASWPARRWCGSSWCSCGLSAGAPGSRSRSPSTSPCCSVPSTWPSCGCAPSPSHRPTSTSSATWTSWSAWCRPPGSSPAPPSSSWSPWRHLVDREPRRDEGRRCLAGAADACSVACWSRSSAWRCSCPPRASTSPATSGARRSTRTSPAGRTGRSTRTS